MTDKYERRSLETISNFQGHMDTLFYLLNHKIVEFIHINTQMEVSLVNNCLCVCDKENLGQNSVILLLAGEEVHMMLMAQCFSAPAKKVLLNV